MEDLRTGSLISEPLVVRQSFLKWKLRWSIPWSAESEQVFGVPFARMILLSYVTIIELGFWSSLLEREIWAFSVPYSEGISVSTTFSVANSRGLMTAFLIRDRAGMNFLSDP